MTRSSADYGIVEGKIVKPQKKVSTRGLNRNHNPQLKRIFKGAAMSALRDPAPKADDQKLGDGGRARKSRVLLSPAS